MSFGIWIALVVGGVVLGAARPFAWEPAFSCWDRSLNNSSAMFSDASIATLDTEATGSFSVTSRILRSTYCATSRMYFSSASLRIESW